MNYRRRLLIVFGAAFTPQALFAQAKPKPVLIGWLSQSSPTGRSRGNLAAFEEEMAKLGWKNGTTYLLEQRWAEGRGEDLPALAEELKQKKPAVIVCSPTSATRAAARAAPETPIVQVLGLSLADVGLAKSLARPGGMVTGLTHLPFELSTKFLELLLTAVPKLTRVGILIPTGPYRDIVQRSAQRALEHHRIEGRIEEVGQSKDLEAAVSRLAKDGMRGLVLMPNPMLSSARPSVIKLALAQGWPVVASARSLAEEGALIGYSADSYVLSRRAAHYVDRILKGAKPGDLPIEQPMTFELMVNLKTAKALGLTMPAEIMVQATQVIQ